MGVHAAIQYIQDTVGNIAIAKPQMYFIMNRDQDPYWNSRPPVDQLFSLQSCGADPKAFTSNKVIIYKPNWCSPGLQAYTKVEVVPNAPVPVGSLLSLGVKKQFSWLATPNVDGYQQDTTAINSFTRPLIHLALSCRTPRMLVFCTMDITSSLSSKAQAKVI